MAKAKFGLNDILNAKSRAAAAGRVEDYEEIYLSPYEVKAAPENTHQSLENIEELADSFLHVGQEQPTVIARVNGEFRIVDGHRRNAANIMNLERGHKEYEKVKYRYKDMTEAMYELSLLAGNGYTQELTAYEKTRLVERTKAALIRAKEEDGLEIKGKMRDLVAAMLNESSTNVARMESINNNATPEIKEQLKNGNMGITAAYEAAKLPEDEQREIAEQAAGGSIRRSRFKTLIMTAHIDKAVEEIERRRKAADRGIEYKAFEMYFMQGMDYAKIAEELDTGNSTPRRWITAIINELSVLLWGMDEDKIRCGWYPLRAERCEVVEVKGQVYLRYLFANGEHGAIEFEKVGIITDFEYTDDLFGEDNRTLKPTMQLIHTQNEGIINAVKNSANIRFLAKVANMLKPEDIKKERERFTEDNLSADNDSGMIIYDNKFSELKQVESKPYTPNALQMQNIQENVCTHFGTNMDILQNKFNEETWNAYYEGKIEPFAIQLSLVMSNMTFSDREIACGNAITFSANRLQYASNATKLQVSTQLFDRALLNRNGVMDIWNMSHVEDGEKYYIRNR